MLACPLCHKNLWHTENGLADHVWHEHHESKICMSHGKASQKDGSPKIKSCRGGMAMARCALNGVYNASPANGTCPKTSGKGRDRGKL